MSEYWMIKTHGDPIGSVRKILATAWGKFDLAGIFVPVAEHGKPGARPRLLVNPQDLKDVNPFTPLMTVNAAREIPALLAEKPGRFGVVLRSCEIRALHEIQRLLHLSFDRLVTICVDCLGTYPVQEYEWRSVRAGSTHNLAEDALHFAPQGGILQYRFRQACQSCSAPGAQGADLNIGVIGLPVREALLVQVSNPQKAAPLRQNGLDVQSADASLVNRRQSMLERIGERQRSYFDRQVTELARVLPEDVEQVANMLAACDDCQACMQVCPICQALPLQADSNGKFKPKDIANWLSCCAGCGMCEQVCPSHMPLSTIFKRVRETILH